MAQVKVWNDSNYDHKEIFKDQEIKIPAKGYIEMEYYEAHEFKGAYKAIERDGDNQPKPQSFKMIRIEEPKAQVEAKVEENRCIACSFRGASAKDLFDHTVAAHAHQVAAVDEEAETVAKSKKKAG